MCLQILWTKALYWQATRSYWFSEDIWTSLISMDRLDLQVVIVYVGVICTRAQGTWRVGVAKLHAWRHKWGRGCNVNVWFPECPLFGGKNTLQKRFGTKNSVRCSEFRGGRFSEVANVLQVWDFQSVTRTLSALGSVSASRSVRSGRFYCTSIW